MAGYVEIVREIIASFDIKIRKNYFPFLQPKHERHYPLFVHGHNLLGSAIVDRRRALRLRHARSPHSLLGRWDTGLVDVDWFKMAVGDI